MPRLRLKISLLAVAMLCLLPGCFRQVIYELNLKPAGETIQRRLAVWSDAAHVEGDDETSPLSETELAHMREFYDPKLEKIEDGIHTFVGSFRGDMPADIGGAGRYAFFESPLGSTSLYTERFRGEDDLQQLMQDRHDVVDQIVGLLITWSHQEFAGQQIQSRIESLLDQDVRRDLKNLSVYGWTFEMIHGADIEAVGQRFAAQMGMYLIERDYLSFGDLPNLLRVFASEDEQAWIELLHDTVIRKLQVNDDESARESLAILGDPQRLVASLRESIRKTEIYQTELARERSKHPAADGDDAEALDVDPLGLLVGDLFQLLPRSIFASVTVKVKLNCGVKPFATNAVWNPDENAVEWSEDIADDNIPAMLFAAWSVPDQDAQKQRFGETILAGESLAKFVYWYRGLTDEQRQRIDVFLDTLAPGGDLVEKINDFRFADDEMLPDALTNLLKQAIKAAA